MWCRLLQGELGPSVLRPKVALQRASVEDTYPSSLLCPARAPTDQAQQEVEGVGAWDQVSMPGSIWGWGQGEDEEGI